MTNKLKTYIMSRPSLNKSGLAKEIGVSPQFLNDVLKGTKRMSEAFEEKLKTVLERYGYQE